MQEDGGGGIASLYQEGRKRPSYQQQSNSERTDNDTGNPSCHQSCDRCTLHLISVCVQRGLCRKPGGKKHLTPASFMFLLCFRQPLSCMKSLKNDSKSIQTCTIYHHDNHTPCTLITLLNCIMTAM